MQWKFGVGQSDSEERREIERAQEAGRAEEYMLGQAVCRLREFGPRMMRAELARRRAHRAERRRHYRSRA
jgi:hypothetical protein